MLSRRIFGGCLLCAGLQLVSSDADAQAAAGLGFTRTVLNQQAVPDTKFDSIQIIVAIQPNVLIARHTHPGIESAVVIEGGGVLWVKGSPDRTIKASDGFMVPADTPHSLQTGAQPTRVAATYIVERGKPLASPAPE